MNSRPIQATYNNDEYRELQWHMHDWNAFLELGGGGDLGFMGAMLGFVYRKSLLESSWHLADGTQSFGTAQTLNGVYRSVDLLAAVGVVFGVRFGYDSPVGVIGRFSYPFYLFESDLSDLTRSDDQQPVSLRIMKSI